MAINFGQQINRALESSLNRVGDSRVRAQQLSQRLQGQQFEQQIQQQVQQLRQREQQLAEEAQTEKIYQNVIQNRMDRRQEQRQQKTADAQANYYNALAENQGNGGGDGVAPESLISSLQSLLNTSNDRLDTATKERQDVQENVQGDLNKPAEKREQKSAALTAEERNDVDEGWLDFTGSIDRWQVDEAEQELQAAKQDSAAAMEQLQPLLEQEQQAQQSVSQVESTLQNLIQRLGGGGGQSSTPQPQQQQQPDPDQESDNDVTVLTQQDLQEYADRHNISVEEAREMWSNQEGYRVEG